jgi:hypothetical protein
VVEVVPVSSAHLNQREPSELLLEIDQVRLFVEDRVLLLVPIVFHLLSLEPVLGPSS